MRLKKIALFSIPFALLIFGLKYWAYSLTGSVAFYSDALESLVNVISALAVYISIHISSKPADKDHPFGHCKAEYFSAGFVSMLIIAAAASIIYSSIMAIIKDEYLFNLNIGTAMNASTIIFNLMWASLLARYGKKYRSEALKADAKHIFSDVMTSFVIIIGLIIVYLTNWYIVDPLLAIFIAIHILWNGWEVFHNSIKGLMDGALSQDEITAIQHIIAHNAQGALEAHDLKTRVGGRIIFIEFHLVVDSTMSVGQSHDICNQIEAALLKKFPYAQILIHVEPEGEAKLPVGTRVLPFA